MSLEHNHPGIVSCQGQRKRKTTGANGGDVGDDCSKAKARKVSTTTNFNDLLVHMYEAHVVNGVFNRKCNAVGEEEDVSCGRDNCEAWVLNLVHQYPKLGTAWICPQNIRRPVDCQSSMWFRKGWRGACLAETQRKQKTAARVGPVPLQWCTWDEHDDLFEVYLEDKWGMPDFFYKRSSKFEMEEEVYFMTSPSP